ncbi:MAG TPA: hypothetical protein VH120_14045 [Gemmataceae bacterium]|nr:hypothetical protein [Gemmataceae bacterium]
MLFKTSDHGALPRLVGRQRKKALQYLVGNPLIAVQMTQHDVRAGRYAVVAGGLLVNNGYVIDGTGIFHSIHPQTPTIPPGE